MNEIFSRSRKYSTIVLCVLAALCEGIDLQAAGLAASGIGAEFRPAPDQLGTFFSASTLGLFFGAIIGGRLADGVGRKKVMVVSVALFGLFSLLTAFATDMLSLTLARGFTGLGLGGALPMLLALVTESSAVEFQRANVVKVYAAMPLGGAAASLISVVITPPHWRALFIIGGLIPLLLATLMSRGLSESVEFHETKTQPPGAGVGSLPGLLTDGRLQRTLLLWVSFLLELLVLYLLLNWLPLLLMADGFTKIQAALGQIGFNLGGVLSALLIGHLLGGRHRHLTLSVVFGAIPVLLVSLAVAPHQFSIVAFAVSLLGCAVLGAQAFLYAAAPTIYPVRIRGMGVGAAVAFGRMGSILGPKLGGTLRAMGHGPSRLLIDILPIVVVGSLCSLWLAWVLGRRPSS